MNFLKTQIQRFILAGISAVFTDFLIYYLLQNFIIIDIAKGISFISGTFVSFFINKYWTFEKNKKSLMELIYFLILYFSSMMINVYVNKLVLVNFEIMILAFVIATGISAVINFLGMKYLIFKK